MVLAVIVACEIGFWVLVGSGLVARYGLRRRRLGAGLLMAAPLVDVVLLVTVAIDLAHGATAEWSHGLAALYIGVSIAYGHPMMAWADARAAHWFDGAPLPQRLSGAAYTAKCWKDLLRTAIAAAVASLILGAIIVLVGAPERTDALVSIFPLLGLVLAVDLLWALSYTIWPRRPRAGRIAAASGR